MLCFYKTLKTSGKYFLRTFLSWTLSIAAAGAILFSGPDSYLQDKSVRILSAQTVVNAPQDPEEQISQPTQDFLVTSPVNWVNAYVEQMQNDLRNNINAYSPDQTVIPDKRNTGIQGGTVLKPFPTSGYIGEISDEEGGDGKKPLFLTVKENEFYNINGYKNTACASQVLIENYNFEDARLYVTNDQKLPGQVVLIFRNCKFREFRSIPGPNLWIVLDHCQTEGVIYASNLIICNSYLHSYNHDAINPIYNVIVKDSYIADLFRGPSDFGVHIDGVQIFGNQYGGVSENIIFDNVRFSIPQISYEGSKDYVNAAINTGLEFSEGYNFLFQNIMIDSGGRWFPIYNTGGDPVLFKNVQVGHGHRRIFYPRYINPDSVVIEAEFSQGLYVSSVWKDEENKTHFLCTNNTNVEKTLTVKTDQQEYTFSMKRHPTPAELSENPTYQAYRFEDLPYDVEFIIEEDISQAIFYDGNRQIRSVHF